MADATPPDGDGWQSIPINPAVLAARAAGLSHGLLVFDDTGSEWTHQGDRFQLRIFPNRFVYSLNRTGQCAILDRHAWARGPRAAGRTHELDVRIKGPGSG